MLCCCWTGTGAWESALTNTLSPGDRIVSFLIGQFSLLWIDQQQRLNFNVDVIESEWGQGANLDILASKLAEDTAHTIKAICIVHNETATGVTNNLATVRKILGKQLMLLSSLPFISLMVLTFDLEWIYKYYSFFQRQLVIIRAANRVLSYPEIPKPNVKLMTC